MTLRDHPATDITERYLSLLKKALTHSLWVERTRLVDPSTMPRSFKRVAVEMVLTMLKPFRLRIVREYTADPTVRELGEDWPEFAHTMIGLKRLNNIEECVKTILADDIPGDFMETGVWRGGAVIFMRALLDAYAVKQRTVWAADSFCGLPRPQVDLYPADAKDICHQREFTAVSIDEVRNNFRLYDLLDDRVRFLQGWFKDTLPQAPIRQLALLRLDGDMYQSTLEALENLYPKLSVGGFLIVDDYAAEPCRQAVHDFRTRKNINDPICRIDNWGVFWRRA